MIIFTDGKNVVCFYLHVHNIFAVSRKVLKLISLRGNDLLLKQTEGEGKDKTWRAIGVTKNSTEF